MQEIKYLPPPAAPPNPVRKFAAALVGAAAVGLGLMFSMMLFVLVVVFAVAAFGYLHWKTRGLRKQLREQQKMAGAMFENATRESGRGEIIEGEATRVFDEGKP
jgi:uncharacterized membrane protein